MVYLLLFAGIPGNFMNTQKQEIDSNIINGRTVILEYLYHSFYFIPDDRYIQYTNKILQVLQDLCTFLENKAELEEIKNCFKEYYNINSLQDIIEKANISFTKFFIAGEKEKDREFLWRNKEISKDKIIISLQTLSDKYGIVKPMKINLPIDNISMEIFLLYQLSKKEQNNQVVTDELYLYENHILKWIDSYFKALEERCSLKNADCLYKGLFIFSRIYLLQDYFFLRGICDEL